MLEKVEIITSFFSWVSHSWSFICKKSRTVTIKIRKVLECATSRGNGRRTKRTRYKLLFAARERTAIRSWITEIFTRIADVLWRADILQRANILPRIMDHCDTAMQYERLRNGHVKKRELFAFFVASSLLGSIWYSSGCSENESTRVESNLRDRKHWKIKLFRDLKNGSSDVCLHSELSRKKRKKKETKRR